MSRSRYPADGDGAVTMPAEAPQRATGWYETIGLRRPEACCAGLRPALVHQVERVSAAQALVIARDIGLTPAEGRELQKTFLRFRDEIVPGHPC